VFVNCFLKVKGAMRSMSRSPKSYR